MLTNTVVMGGDEGEVQKEGTVKSSKKSCKRRTKKKQYPIENDYKRQEEQGDLYTRRRAFSKAQEKRLSSTDN